MIKLLLLFGFIANSVLNAQTSKTPSGVQRIENPRIENPISPKIIIHKNSVTANNDGNISKYNIKNLKLSLENGDSTMKLDSNMISATRTIMQDMNGTDISNSANPNKLTTKALKINPDFKDNSSIQEGFDKETQEGLIEKSIDNQYISLLDKADTIKCYIARDISFEWECPAGNKIYGGYLNSNGKSARLKCDSECFQEYSCSAVVSGKDDTVEKEDDFSCDFSLNPNGCDYSKNFISLKAIRNIYMDINESNSKNFSLTVKTGDGNGEDTNLIDHISGILLDSNITIPVKKEIASFKIHISPTKDNIETLRISNIKVSIENKGSWICPMMQDINIYPDNDFSTKCVNGNIVKLDLADDSNISICNDGSMGADNSNGTFSSEEGCKSVCRTGVSCVPNTTIMTTNELKYSFREACIEGQANCSNTQDDCKKARLGGSKILHEVVFDATSNGSTTVENSVAIQGVDRPRVNPVQPTGESDYEKIQREEWKDKAFKNMVEEGKYAISNTPIGDDSDASSGFRKGATSGANYGAYNSSGIYSLSWNLKPRALDVNNNISYHLYAVIEVELFYFGYDNNAEQVKKGKKIWYIKKNFNNDDLEAIKYGDNTGLYKDTGIVNPNTKETTFKSVFIKNTTATIDYKKFNSITKQWNTYNPSLEIAPFFKTMKFGVNSLPYWDIPIILNLHNIVNDLEGTVKRVVDNSNGRVKYYDGKFDGTGDGMLVYTVYTGYSQNKLDIDTIFSKIDSGEFSEIYKFKEDRLFRNQPISDTPNSKLIKIYQYGASNKATIFVTIKPKKEDIGRKGFIYVFFQ